MTRTEQLVQQAQEKARQRANVLQSGLGKRLHLLNQPEYARLRASLEKTKHRRITLLDEAVAADIISADDYRRFMGEHLDDISLSDLLAAL